MSTGADVPRWVRDPLGDATLQNLDAVIAANRFGLGARPGELQLIGREAREWLAQQIVGTRAPAAAIRALPSAADNFRVYAEAREEIRRARAQAADARLTKHGATATKRETAKKTVQGVRARLVPLYLDQVAARYRAATAAPESFRERLVHFWTNHFAVSADRSQVIALAGTLENEAIRPHIAGSFADMLLAVESHPAMILYLDNQTSIGPHSALALRVARRPRGKARKLGINENLAREILELHTLGVHGGYTQADVTTFAEVLTGWSIGGDRGPLAAGKTGEFMFHEPLHEPGPRTMLGKRYGEAGIEQPRAVLHDLARHPATAKHVAVKLVRHFVADDPPQGVVDRVEKAFLDSEGDLPTVHRVLIESPEAWSPVAAKFKTPHEFVLSVFRAFDHLPQQPQQILAPFELLGQRPYTPGSPAGWADTADRWDGPDALLKRIEWSNALGERVAARAKPLVLSGQTLGAALSDHTRTAISRAASSAQGVTLLLASPEFQRR